MKKIFVSFAIGLLGLSVSAQAAHLTPSETAYIQTISTYGNSVTQMTYADFVAGNYFGETYTTGQASACRGAGKLSSFPLYRTFVWNGNSYLVEDVKYAQMDTGLRIKAKLVFLNVYDTNWNWVGPRFELDSGSLAVTDGGNLYNEVISCQTALGVQLHGSGPTGAENTMRDELADAMSF